MPGTDTHGSDAHAKQFTWQAANATLPLVRAIVQDIVDLYGGLELRQSRVNSLRRRKPRKVAVSGSVYQEEVDQVQDELDRDLERLNGYFAELLALGLEVRDAAIGLVDFPTRFEPLDPAAKPGGFANSLTGGQSNGPTAAGAAGLPPAGEAGFWSWQLGEPAVSSWHLASEAPHDRHRLPAALPMPSRFSANEASRHSSADAAGDEFLR